MKEVKIYIYDASSLKFGNVSLQGLNLFLLSCDEGLDLSRCAGRHVDDLDSSVAINLDLNRASDGDSLLDLRWGRVCSFTGSIGSLVELSDAFKARFSDFKLKQLIEVECTIAVPVNLVELGAEGVGGALAFVVGAGLVVGLEFLEGDDSIGVGVQLPKHDILVVHDILGDGGGVKLEAAHFYLFLI